MAEVQRPWLKYRDKQVPVGIDYQVRPMAEFLADTASKWPGRNAVVFRNFKITYAGLDRAAGVLAANLKAQGLRKGDRVAIMLPNSPQCIMAYWGVLRAGGVVVMTNPLYMETELIHQFNDSGARFLITLDLLWPRIEALGNRISLDRIFITRMSDALRFPLNLLYTLKSKRDGGQTEIPFDERRILPWKALIKGRETFEEKTIDPKEDAALLQYTGGTTGVAKGCVITHYNLAANMQQCRAVFHTMGKDHETFLGVLPYFHIYGLTVCLNFPTSLGATLAPFPRFSPKDVLVAAEKLRPTIFPGAPSVYIALLQQKDAHKYDLSSIRYCISGSAPIPVEYIDKFQKITGGAILEGFGLTEASPVTHINPLGGVRKPGSIGLPMPDTDARIVDMEVGSVDVGPGNLGELIVRGPQIMKGYYNRPDETASALRNGWLYTGDIAKMDEEGYFYIMDRKKDMVISGGYNIYPREIDEVLHAHPKIREAVAVGIPHASRGESLKAFVVLEPDQDMTRSEVIAYCRQKLANYKVPRQVEFRDDLPKSMVGKVLRKALRAEESEKADSGGRRRSGEKFTLRGDEEQD